MESNKKILLFNVKEDKSAQIKFLCESFGIQTITVAKEQYNEPLGVLAGIKGIAKSGLPYRGREFKTEMMVFYGVDSDALDKFLEKYRENNIEPINLKAVITFHNMFWSAKKLHSELLKEHMNFQGK